MLGKIALTALIIGVVWMLFMRGTKTKRRAAKPIPPNETLIKCPDCDSYRIAGTPCPCRTES
ncbi:MAG: hypothetical protein AAGH74_12715 [Pseudomonadota bacterium]